MKQSLIILGIVFLTACSSAPVITPSITPAPISVVIIPDTPTPTLKPLPTPTQTTEQMLYPYTIAGLREHQYQSGKITIRAMLLETEIFTRYSIEYPSDGLVITGILQIPTLDKLSYPVIIMNHGFFSRTVYHSGDGTDRAAEFLNRRGYLTLSSDYRSWGESETGESLFYSGLAIDVVNLVNAVSSIPEADSNHIGMWGHSMGGGVTLKVLTLDPHIKAAVLYSSVSADFADIIARWGPGCLGDVLQGEISYGCNSSDVLPLNLPDDLIASYFKAVIDSGMLKDVSPLYHIHSITAPVQIHYGTEDGKTSAGTPPEWSKKIYKAFIEANKETQLFGYEGEAHSFRGDEWFAFMERSAQFFDKYVKGD